MIVGNGSVPDGTADVIDAADLVVRFNMTPSFPASGHKTDVLAVCNTGRPAKAMLSSEDWLDSEPVRDCAEIWSVRDPEKFRRFRPQLAISHPELDDFCDDYTEDFERLAERRGKVHRIISRRVHEVVDAELSVQEPGDYVVPSSGMVVVAHVLSEPAFAADTICLAGFSHEGWEGHPFSAERRLIGSLIVSGRLTRLSLPNASSLSQGA
ncbi:MAG: Urease operon accessory protein [Shinella sp.]|nr:MAG: Urease operon accessory protein [Shinella sp.]